MGPSQEIGVLSCIVQKITAWGWYRLLESRQKYWNLATIVQGVAPQLTVVPAPPLNQALERM